MGKVTRIVIVVSIFLLAQFSSVVAGASFDDELRVWTDKSGKFSVDAKFVKRDGELVTLLGKDGVELEIEFKRLSRKDRTYIVRLSKMKSAKKKAAKGTKGKKELAEPKIKFAEAAPPNPNCETCMGIGLVPFTKFKPLSRNESGKGRSPLESKIGDCCPDCQKDQDPFKFVKTEWASDELIKARHEEIEELFGSRLQRYETPYMTIHSNLNEKRSLHVAKAVQLMEMKLQKRMGNLVFSTSRRGRDDFYLVSSRAYPDAVEAIRKEATLAEMNWEHAKTLTGFSQGKLMACRLVEEWDFQLANQAIFTVAGKQIAEATGYNQPDWLSTGFASVLEYDVMGNNLIYVSPAKYQQGVGDVTGRVTPEFARNWDAMFKRLAQSGKASNWDTMLEKDFLNFTTVDDLQSKSMAAFLMSKPKEFTQFAIELSSGSKQQSALEKAYSMKLDELEKAWKKWVGFR